VGALSEYEGPRTEAFLIGEHFSRIGHAPEAMLWKHATPEEFASSYGILVDQAEIFCYPWLVGNKKYEAWLDKPGVMDLPEDVDEWTGSKLLAYVRNRNEQLKLIYQAVHDGGIIHPRNLPIIDTRKKIQDLMDGREQEAEAITEAIQ
jgi:hypothetical protein